MALGALVGAPCGVAQAARMNMVAMPVRSRFRTIRFPFQKLGSCGFQNSTGPVSYTHLRAHETVLDLVCRLLLEKKKQQQHTTQHTTTRNRLTDYNNNDINNNFIDETI